MTARRLALALLCAGAAGAAHAAPAGADWITAWYAPPVVAIPALTPTDVRDYVGVTVRQRMRLETAGRSLRVVLTNELGTSPIHVGDVHIALLGPDGRQVAGTDRALTFSGRRETILPDGAPMFSDPVALAAPAFAEAEVSVYYVGPNRPAAHLEQVEVSAPGDHAAEPDWPNAIRGRGPALASRIDVQATTARRVLVALGDSITEGAGSTPGAHMDWPEQFARRLAKAPGGDRWSVINSGISGNRLLHDGGGAGPNTLARFDRDALDIPGATDILLLEGINDIGWGTQPQGAGEEVSADDIIAADRQLIERAHARGLRIYGALLTPYQGAVYYDAEGETKRETVNAFIKSGAFDGVVDFASAVADPANPLRYNPADDHGDHLHPSDAGYSAMTAAIPLSLLGVR